ncbi:MAG: ABC transporter permease subunit [Firmicutes bacterium]|nr:ABC transporter permease subunit [Bacillota bacterium]
MNTFHIMRKELRNYFSSTIAYAFLAIFLFIVGFFFYMSMVNYSMQSTFAARNPMMIQRMNPSDLILSPLFSLMGFLLIFLIPVLTMRLFAEERKLGTIELLFTYPITEMQLVMGKFLAAVSVLVLMFGFTTVYMVLFTKAFGYVSTQIPWGSMGAGYLGLFLLSMAFMAFGMWVSSMTSDQVTSALATVGGLLVFWIIGSARMDLSGPLMKVVEQISLVEHFQDFTKGVIDTHHIIYLVCFILFFVFLTIQVMEVRKWKG